jgi:tRNA nucleotidyltransferase (CCA-adding enzyme)
VDRAINHKLGHAAVQRFMQAGQVMVRATDSIATLRKIMVATNWGQVPVVDEQGKLIGIVTRTDLIKLWDEQSLPADDVDEINQRLQATLSPTQLALLHLIGREVDALNYRVYLVGGFVRDLLLDGHNAQVSALDMDIVIEGDAIAFAQHIQRQYGGRIVAHKRFGTAKWLLTQADYPLKLERLQSDLFNAPDQSLPNAEFQMPNSVLPTHLDFVTARTEFYTAPTVLPTVELSNIKLDLHRRDFTINTLAICLNPDRWGELLDFYGGLTDLKQGVVRVLHSLSFVDDPTRILRAVRYEQRFGFQLDLRTLELMQDALDLVTHLSAARLRHELERLLQEAQPEKGLARLADLGVLASIHPDLVMPAWLSDCFSQLRQRLAEPTADPELKATALPHLYWALLAYPLSATALATLQARLHLENTLPRLMADMIALRAMVEPLRDPALQPSQVVALLEQIDMTAQGLFRILELEPSITVVLTRYATTWRLVRPALTGRDLAGMGLPSGPIYGELLNQLRAAKLDGVLSTRKEEEAYVAKMLAEYKL